MNQSLIEKYNVPGPRYTSYPTVPFWEHEPLDVTEWTGRLKKAFQISNSSKGIAVYIHLPFCSNMCHYCGCNVRFTQNHEVEVPYLKKVLKEWEIYLNILGEQPEIAELHLGGGTPTFFSPEHLKMLIEGIFAKSKLRDDAELSFEAHPGNTTKAHLETLYQLGFRRVSFGIQDFDPVVQEIINRVQTVETVTNIVNEARVVGYTSINFDLIYGLPKQTNLSIQQTITEVKKLQPERIAFYSYAHVPWIKGVQRKFSEEDLPKDDAKRALYELGKALFEEAGYEEIGMDHFALPKDSLYQSAKTKSLHRNFMGYTTNNTDVMIGLGVSSISDSFSAFAQNYKTIRQYEKALEQNQLPVYRGHFSNEEDERTRKHILNLMCHFETKWSDEEKTNIEQIETINKRLQELEQDGLVKTGLSGVTVTLKGIPFVRNICMAFDHKLHQQQPKKQLFSSTV